MFDPFGIVLTIVVVVVGIPLLWVLYVDFGGHLIGDVIERPPWSRTVRLMQLALGPVVLYLAWDLNFRHAVGVHVGAGAAPRRDVGDVPVIAIQHRVGGPDHAGGAGRRLHVLCDQPLVLASSRGPRPLATNACCNQ
jgi:hypothetical protein